MSGHNKWSKIKHKKEAGDAKKSKLFSMLVKTITIESKRVGGDIKSPSLRVAIEKAKACNMPIDNIERAIKKGQASENNDLEEIIYEAYGPGGVAVIIEGITDNKNRTTAEIKHVLSAHQASLQVPGSALWAFFKKDGEWCPHNLIPLSTNDSTKLVELINELEDHEDIKKVYFNTQIEQ